MAKRQMNYRIKIDETEDIPNKVRGLDIVVHGVYSHKQALSGYLSKRNLRYLFDDLYFRFINNEGVTIDPADEYTRTERKKAVSGISREGQVHYLANLFGHKRFERLGEKPLGDYLSEEEKKLDQMLDDKVFAIFMKYYETENTF